MNLNKTWMASSAVVLLATVGPTGAIDWCGDDEPGTPIVLSFDEAGFRFTDPSHGVGFDLDADGELERISWTAPGFDQAFLVLDRDGNGRIDSGAELFGDATPQPLSPQPNGYVALAVFDLDGDGFITDVDAIYPELGLWNDANHDGVSQPGEIVRLADRGIVALDLDYSTTRRLDQHGNLLRWISVVHFTEGRRWGAVDVIFRAR